MGGFGFPTILLQLPHNGIGGVNVNDFGLMLTIGFGEQEAMIMRMVSTEERGDGQSDDVPIHCGYLPFSSLRIHYSTGYVKSQAQKYYNFVKSLAG